MILILGGTTEGRASVRIADEGSGPYYYSTKGSLQEIECAHGIRLTGGMNTASMETFCREKGIRLLIDAAHPFATALHQTVAKVSSSLQIPVIRYERRYPPRDTDLIWCDDYTDAVRKLEEQGIHRLLALTGVNTIAPLRPWWEKYPAWFRILKREESLTIATGQGFPIDHLLFYQNEDDAGEMMDRLQPDAIITKESGQTGYFIEKVAAARKRSIPVFVVKRPVLPETFYIVYGEDGLRKQIERLLPEFYPLHHGYTTGACATAAAKAALIALLNKEKQIQSSITLSSGELITLPVAETEWEGDSAICSVIKDAGDDPDVTNGSKIVAKVTLSKEPASAPIRFVAGTGVGTVTLPGLGLEVGGPAINTTPRKMMTEELTSVLEEYRQSISNHTKTTEACGLIVTISVPGGEELATRTFNPKLGIVGGISIIGTSGIVRPFSTDAFIASIRKETEVAKAIGCTTLIVNSGAKSERYLKARYPELPPQAFVHYGNFIGETLKIASSLDFPQVVMGIMIGKAVKLAEGFLDTHSKKVVMNKDFLKDLAHQAGCAEDTIQKIDTITLARELWQLLPAEEQETFFNLLLKRCHEHCTPLLPKGELSILLITEEGVIWK
ncbi:cobalt-precorrin-5B (C(1))-methyltransferase CbiD [Parabacteroides faecis]|uniref:cobalt-precorrin-5B (C(1))-methyltransferase CbiD n=1 Tax=Parabacteroides faecis TaxID=1217282 RepID=UPI0021649C4C|nr:cobalt-precorrin-5B (C(1))-methyltransferase CbiD [Parabacteroides faecis]MCS2892935.1 cobalt-precorrin-5B (C(1))-methyltransferase CbiD [Parabacteroides faecis]UVQ48458.1 cobalt-precorrin-5B (C(1))-methyltransferase CbiD [Parabacteroides faecis]